MPSRVNSSGLVIAGTGFFLTRFTVTLALYEDPVQFLLSGVVPLGLGLGLAAFGVALAVADVDPAVVRTTAVWCVVGTGAMLVLALLTLLGATGGGTSLVAAFRAESHLSSFIIGGSVGGTLTGLYASGNRRHRLQLRHQANRLEVLNRLLRHEVLNAVTVIKGYAELGDRGGDDRGEIIRTRAADIERTIEEVKHLARDVRHTEAHRVPVSLDDCLAAAVETVRSRHPDAVVEFEAPETGLRVLANDHLELVFIHLLEHALDSDPAASTAVAVRVEPSASRVRVHVDAPGSTLPASQRRLLETGEIERYDDPTTGFDLNVVRLFVESVRGEIETSAADGGTTVTVVVPREREDATGLEARPAGLAPVRPAAPQLVVTLVAALLAGGVYGLVSEALGGSVAFIGVFYGTADPLVGWLTHEFHSVVFGFVFVGLLSLVPDPHRGRLGVAVGVGLAWSVVLWLFAAGVVAPVWLRLLGIPASVPNLTGNLFAAHLAWGGSLGVLVSGGLARVAGRRADRRDPSVDGVDLA